MQTIAEGVRVQKYIAPRPKSKTCIELMDIVGLAERLYNSYLMNLMAEEDSV